MKLTIVAHPRSKKEYIKKHDERYFDIYFNVFPERGRANKKIIEMLSEYLGVPSSKTKIMSGRKGALKNH